MPESDAETIARLFHETYERMAPGFGYETRKETAVAWEDLPENNRNLMTAVAQQVLIFMEGLAPKIAGSQRVINMESGVSHFDGHPFVTLRWGDEAGQMSPDEVREHAKWLMQTAEAADTDALLLREFPDTNTAMGLVMLLREGRQKGWPERKNKP